jgi:4-amino-4-deoxy-L-arabinose transferase-like glycosyltransferase
LEFYNELNLMLKKMIAKIWLLDDWLMSHIPLLILLLILLLLRIPNFFEPYWYGDEGIYLTIGNALRDGERLYAEIIDHKTPIIYYLAMLPSQMWFRLLLLFWMMATTAAFHHLSKLLIKPLWLAVTTTFGFILLTTLPWLEGHIANGELFVMGFILAGSYFLSLTETFTSFIDQTVVGKFTTRDRRLVLVAGILFGLAILTKVPGVLDVAAFFSIGWFLVLKQKHPLSGLAKLLPRFLWLGLGVLIPLGLSVIYFVARGSGQAYLDFGLLYNFRYAGSWQLPFSQPLLVWLFSLPGKITVLALVVLGLSLMHKRVSAAVIFLTSWSLLALIGATLSNRPYPHYFLQAVPPLVLLIGLGLSHLTKWAQTFGHPRKTNPFPVAEVGSSLLLTSLFVAVLILLEVGLYQTQKYYSDFYRLVTRQISPAEYRNGFNYLMADNYLAAEVITSAGASEIFIWGTNPMLYALSDTQPTGRFTVSFHIQDFNAYGETLADLVAAEPIFIVVMNNEADHDFPGFYEYLHQHYIPNQNFDHYTLWKRQSDLEQL